jgi:hypothetical protein
MLLIFCLVVCSFANTSLFSSFLTCNSSLSSYSFSKAPCKFWTNLSFSSVICLFMISKLESLNIMLVICVLYYVAYWNILVTFLCSSKFASSPCINLGVWNLGVCFMELVFEEPTVFCEVHISPKMFVFIVEFGFKGSIPSLFYGIKTHCYTLGKFGSNSCIFSFTSSWAWDCGSLLGHL